jgi:squalene-hopene/tetraprenyl-beta-curcumene cyclase
VALRRLGVRESEVLQIGTRWLVDLQNTDGGWPTFCRGWGHLPFDRSGADLTAHALRALRSSLEEGIVAALRNRGAIGPRSLPGFGGTVIDRGFAYLARQQRADGSWLPLWFGNQHVANDENPVYGTSRVLAAYRDFGLMDEETARRGVAFLLAVQHADGGWGGAGNTPSSIEETALAVEVLLGAGATAGPAAERGLAWLVDRIERGGLDQPAPIGFYFARLWYYEKLYPVIFALAALGRARLA